MHTHKILNIAPLNIHLQSSLSKELGISKILAQILINRGITTIQAAEQFLNINLEDLSDPFLFSDMHKAVNIIKNAVGKKTKVMVFGDYDVDGITSLTLLKTTLFKLGIDAIHYLPHRLKEGYGLNKNILHLVKEKNIELLITVDCGTNSYKEIEELRRHNIDVIVTDHHEPLSYNLSSASAIINPKIQEADYKYKDLAGVGVTYKLCQAVTGQTLIEDLDLVSLGTIADVVPLTGDNRIFAKIGLSRILKTKRLGLQALMETSGIKNKKISSSVVSYILGPRINASGRVGTAEIALHLLMAQNKLEADQLARTVEAYNRQRQKIEDKILDEVEDLISREINFKEHKIIVIAKEGWHEGVLGIVASKLADRFYRPAILISLTEGLCKGSGRSIKNFHLFNALLECKEFLEMFGGHSHAVGLVITKNSLEDFKRKINLVAGKKLLLEDLLPSLEIDMELLLSDLNEGLLLELEKLEPFGTANPEPLFYTRNLKAKSKPQVLGKDTLKFWVSDGGVTYSAIGFGMGSYRDSLLNTDYFDLVYTPKLDNWQGQDSILLEVKDIFFKYKN